MAAFVGGGFTLLSLFVFFCSYGTLLPFIFLPLYSGAGPAEESWFSREEACRLETEAQCLEMEGLGKVEAVVAGSETEGFYGLLRGAMLHSSLSSASPPHKKICHTPSATISHLPPQESTGPEVPKPADQAMKSASPAVLSASEEAIPAHMQPLGIQLGGIK